MRREKDMVTFIGKVQNLTMVESENSIGVSNRCEMGMGLVPPRNTGQTRLA